MTTRLMVNNLIFNVDDRCKCIVYAVILSNIT